MTGVSLSKLSFYFWRLEATLDLLSFIYLYIYLFIYLLNDEHTDYKHDK